mgnify:CR=1 FL=1
MKLYKVVKNIYQLKLIKQINLWIIQTLEGVMHANAGDWIITGTDGEKWPVKKEIFEKTYRIISGKR